MPHINEAGLALIKSFEGCLLYAYDDANDKRIEPGDAVIGTLTIGWGHTKGVYAGQTITQEQADALLASDLVYFEDEVQELTAINLSPNEFAALVSWDFNTGGLLDSPGMDLINKREFTAAWDDHFCLWNKDGAGNVLDDLVRRRAAEKALFFS